MPPPMLALLAALAVVVTDAPALPDRLPPLDDALLADPAPAPPSPLTFFAAARLRAELDEGRAFSRAGEDATAGAVVTGRVGVTASLDAAQLVVIVGDGGRIGRAPSAPTLVARPPVPSLYQAELSFDFDVAGLPATFGAGRVPLTLADGRLVGTEPFDARGRTLDGVRVRVGSGALALGLGGFWLGDETLSDPTSAWSALAVLDADAEPVDGMHIALVGLLHRDGPAAVTVPTAGARLRAAFGVLALRAGADVQAPFVDGATAFAPAGTAGHAEAGARLAIPVPTLLLGIELGGELTAGDVVGGRTWRAPAPTQHGTLGALDLVAQDNTWSAALRADAASDDGLLVELVGRVVGIADPKAALLDVAGTPLSQRVAGGVALLELDAGIALPLGEEMGLGVVWGVAIPGAALVGDYPAQRFLVTMWASTDAAHAVR